MTTHVTRSITLLRKVKRLIMGYMNVIFIVRNDVVFVLNTSNENMKLKMGLLHLIEHK
jgi:hypothetical protein